MSSIGDSPSAYMFFRGFTLVSVYPFPTKYLSDYEVPTLFIYTIHGPSINKDFRFKGENCTAQP